MANFGQLILTNLGLQAQIKAQSGNALKFKRIGMGSGKYSGNIMALTKLVSENVSVAISNGYAKNSTYTVEGFFSNDGLQTGFAWREIGLFVEDASGKEILYCYANAGDSYDYIPATVDERYSKYIRIATAIGNATDISIVENEGILYVDTRTFDELRLEVNQLWPSKEESGDVVVVDDSANLPFLGMNIYGKSSQIATTGRNLIDNTYISKTVSGLNISVNSDKSITINGTATAQVDIYVCGSWANTDNVLVVESGTFLSKGTGNANIQHYIIKDSNSIANNSTGEDITFKVTEGGIHALMYRVLSGVTVNNTVYPMIRDYYADGDEYEPYTGGAASPSPDYPQDLDSLTSVVGVCGKNLLDNVTIINAVNCTAVSDGRKCVLTTTSQAYVNVYFACGEYDLFVGKTVTLQFKNSFSNNVVARMGNLANNAMPDGEHIAGVTVSAGQTCKLTAEIPAKEDSDLFGIRLLISAASLEIGTNITLEDIQIEIGTAATTYEEYKGLQTIELGQDIRSIPVKSGGNYTDKNERQWICDEIDFEQGVFINRIGVYEVTGAESWYISNLQNFSSEGYYRYDVNTSVSSGAAVTDVLCTHFPYTGSNMKGAWALDQSPGLSLRIICQYSSVDALKEFLVEQYEAGTPVTFYYALWTPVETALTSEQIAAYKALVMNNPCTTVLNDAGANMKVEYVTNTFEPMMKDVFNHVADTNNPHGVTAEQVGAISMELLWENASPTSAFAAQTVALNLDGFSGVSIYFKNQSSGSVYNSTGFIGKGEEFTLVYVPTTSSSITVTRKGTVDDSGVNFMAASNDTTTYDIPLKIYGIKGVIA